MITVGLIIYVQNDLRNYSEENGEHMAWREIIQAIETN